MRRCSCCKKLYPESFFYTCRSARDGLHNVCKRCSRLQARGLKADEVRAKLGIKLPKRMTALDGFKISVQGYAKKGEHIYNIIETRNSQYYGFNDKEQFFIKLEKLLERGM